ncbi:diguanylate cyclase, partial [Bradyrhizobium sp. PRIMUS42]|uniref:GGDEF domain-containing protein n=1 Tax=Bradyrhizobium sp. PRIMUS42 TaxID=2908926 RepID=UPI001FF3C2AF
RQSNRRAATPVEVHCAGQCHDRQVLLRQDAAACIGKDIPIAISIGVAEWDRGIGQFPDRLIAHADHALYAAKKNGKNDFAVYDPAPPLSPEPVGPHEGARKIRLEPC